MNINEFCKISDTHWEIPPSGKMRVPAIIHASAELVRAMDDKVREQLVNVTTLPGIVGAAQAISTARRGLTEPGSVMTAVSATAACSKA